MSNTAIPQEQATAIVAALLTDSRLTAYYHRDTHPQRFPLQLVNATEVLLEAPDQTKTGVSAILLGSGQSPDPARAALILDDISVTASTATIAFRFPVEGLTGKATLVLNQAGSWSVSEMRLLER